LANDSKNNVTVRYAPLEDPGDVQEGGHVKVADLSHIFKFYGAPGQYLLFFEYLFINCTLINY
jgi:hypothetical protein